MHCVALLWRTRGASQVESPLRWPEPSIRVGCWFESGISQPISNFAIAVLVLYLATPLDACAVPALICPRYCGSTVSSVLSTAGIPTASVLEVGIADDVIRRMAATQSYSQ